MPDNLPPHCHEALIPADHPCLPGHFPGQPVVPGVLILERVMQAIAASWPTMQLGGLANAKFVAPLLPEQGFEIRLRLREDGASLEFECQRDGQRLAQGRFLLTRVDA